MPPGFVIKSIDNFISKLLIENVTGSQPGFSMLIAMLMVINSLLL